MSSLPPVDMHCHLTPGIVYHRFMAWETRSSGPTRSTSSSRSTTPCFRWRIWQDLAELESRVDLRPFGAAEMLATV
jgi:hypothetical protein